MQLCAKQMQPMLAPTQVQRNRHLCAGFVSVLTETTYTVTIRNHAAPYNPPRLKVTASRAKFGESTWDKCHKNDFISHTNAGCCSPGKQNGRKLQAEVDGYRESARQQRTSAGQIKEIGNATP